MENQQEVRTFNISSLEVREVEDGPPVIVGYAAVFNQRSLDLGGFVEEILPGAFRRTLQSNPDVRATVEHEGGLTVIGRTRNGTLSLAEDDHGLRVRITPPATQTGQDTLTLVRGGYMDQMSFMFRIFPNGDEWKKTADGLPLRRLKDVDLNDGDVALVTYPAYPQTSAEARAKAKTISEANDDPEAAGGGPSGSDGPEAEAEARAATLRRRVAIAARKEV